MIEVRMLKTMDGSPDGMRVNTYQAGQVYTLPDDLGGVFLREGWAEEQVCEVSDVSEVEPERPELPEPTPAPKRTPTPSKRGK
ncbi:MAG: hypothetical protein A2V59_06830 [Armatimonadetes bacterium RBG_19FT_COMBO_69_19]|nr:MAG: hypothetical protein A2V59_06830 [Armatimonadetes bacterium RBG_19FT_COMBO_69_19]